MVIGKYSQWTAEIDERNWGTKNTFLMISSVLVEIDADKLNRAARLVAYKYFRNPPGKLIRRETVVDVGIQRMIRGLKVQREDSSWDYPHQRGTLVRVTSRH
jgi:hypothetical protein